MSGNKNTVSCPKCAATNTLRGKAMTRALTCQSCNTYFRVGSPAKETVEFQHKEAPAIPIGTKGKVDDYVYEVMGFTVKQETKYHYKWREYLVFNPFRGYAFLSEYNGHWNFIWPVEQDPRNKPNESDFIHEGSHYRLYQRYNAEVVYAKGEFFFDVFNLTLKANNYEYIAPPFLFAFEKTSDSILWCKGEYFSPSEIAKAFNIPQSKLPDRSGVGYTQTFQGNFSDQSLISFTVIMLLIALAAHLVINSNTEQKVVFNATYNQNELKDQKLIVTPSFELKNTKSLEVYIDAPLSNDWFFSEFTLVNETTGSEFNFTKEVEYYSGYDDEGYWSEGSKTGEAFLSQIPEGKYHLNIYPEFSFSNHSFTIIVTHDVPMQINFWLTVLVIVAYPAYYFIRLRHKEQQRWSDSDFSPYHTDDE